MMGTSQTAIVDGRFAKAGGFASKFTIKLAPLWGVFGRAFETEVALRRPFLWLPVAAGTGVVLYLYADREPSLWLIAPAAMSLGVLAYLARANRVAFFFLCGFCAVFAGELSAALRTARVAAPVLDKTRIVTLQGLIEEMTFAATARASCCGFIPPKGLRRNRRRSGSGFRCAGRRLSRRAAM